MQLRLAWDSEPPGQPKDSFEMLYAAEGRIREGGLFGLREGNRG
jgi:hypothetical protein